MSINKEIALEILKKLPHGKKETLKRALMRNYILTSSYLLEHCNMAIYKEGFYLYFTGCRCNFRVFAYDNDGELNIASRKPNENKLNFLYADRLKFSESDFKFI